MTNRRTSSPAGLPFTRPVLSIIVAATAAAGAAVITFLIVWMIRESGGIDVGGLIGAFLLGLFFAEGMALGVVLFLVVVRIVAVRFGPPVLARETFLTILLCLLGIGAGLFPAWIYFADSRSTFADHVWLAAAVGGAVAGFMVARGDIVRRDSVRGDSVRGDGVRGDSMRGNGVRGPRAGDNRSRSGR